MLAVVIGDDEDGRSEATPAPAFHLQCEQDSRHEAKSRYPAEDPTGDPAQTRRAPASVEVAQITVMFGWVFARFAHVVALYIGTSERVSVPLQVTQLICGSRLSKLAPSRVDPAPLAVL